ncbi:MAG: hypothetical protein F4X83_08730 [Chloroflexi bacterium]|nr:hypothetical protein [Chloroflexota bacterium]
MKSSKNSKISIRKHLPLSVRVHYDTVRNFSPMKLFGVGVMALIAVFGTLLAFQVTGSQSQATSTGTYSKMSVVSYASGGEVEFRVAPIGGLARIDLVQYHSSTRDLNKSGCESVHDNSPYGNYTDLSKSSGKYTTPNIARTMKTLCIRVEITITSHPDVPPIETDEFHSFAINRSSVTPRIIIKQVSDELGLRLEATANVEVVRTTWQNAAIKLTQKCDQSLWDTLGSDEISSGQVFLVPTEGRPTQHVACFRVRRATTVSLGNPEATYIYGQLPVAGSTPTALEDENIAETSTFAHRPVIKVVKNGNTYSGVNTNTNASIYKWKYVIRNDSTCDSSVFTNGGQDPGNLIKPQYTDTFTPGNNEEVDKYNGKYICFDALSTTALWAKEKAGAKLSLTAVNEPEEDPTATTVQQATPKPGPVLEVTKDGNTYTVSNTNTEVTIHKYKYVIRNDSTCDSSVFTNGGQDPGNLIKPQYTDTFTPGNNEEVDKYNGKYICFDAVATNDVWAKKKVSVKLSLTAIDEDAEEPEAEEPDESEPEETTQLADTGIFDDGNNAGQLIGYVLIAAAVLGTARILVVKKYKKIG